MKHKKQRLGIFGGSFDPPHGGHLHAARAAQGAFQLDRVLFVPAARPPHKPGRRLASGADRLALLELLITGEADFELDGRELSRSGPSFSVDTLEQLRVEFDGELFLILGTDNLAGLPDWRSISRILELAQPIVIHRAGDELAPFAALAGRLTADELERLRAGLVELPPVRISSTQLREQVRRGETPGELLPRALRDYIDEHGLYLELP